MPNSCAKRLTKTAKVHALCTYIPLWVWILYAYFFEETEISNYSVRTCNIKSHKDSFRQFSKWNARAGRLAYKQNELLHTHTSIWRLQSSWTWGRVTWKKFIHFRRNTVSIIRTGSTLKMYARGSSKSRSILPDYTASLPVKAKYKYITTLLILNVCLNPHFASVWTLLYYQQMSVSTAQTNPAPVGHFQIYS
jgi:hypothetical protein